MIYFSKMYEYRQQVQNHYTVAHIESNQYKPDTQDQVLKMGAEASIGNCDQDENLK